MKRRTRTHKDDSTSDWTVIYCDDSSEVEQCITDHRVIWPILQRTVARLIEEDRTTLPSIEIRSLEMVGSVWVTVNRKDIEATLSKLLRWREANEEYEECAEIRDLMEAARKTVGSVKIG